LGKPKEIKKTGAADTRTSIGKGNPNMSNRKPPIPLRNASKIRKMNEKYRREKKFYLHFAVSWMQLRLYLFPLNLQRTRTPAGFRLSGSMPIKVCDINVS
jgi:hypothetical protein